MKNKNPRFILSIILFSALTGFIIFLIEEKEESKSPTGQILEIAVRKVKPGQLEVFEEKRSAFITYLKTLDGVVTDGEFEATFVANPDGSPNMEAIVYIGMTTWESKEKFDAAAEAVMNNPIAGEFFTTFDFLSYGQYQPTDGKSINLDEIIAGGIQELPIRKIRDGITQDEFEQKRDAFIKLIEIQQGFISNREFKTIGDDGTLVGILLWDKRTKMNEIGLILLNSEEFRVYATVIDNLGYFLMRTTTSQL